MLSETFWMFVITSTIGCCLGAIKILYKSKCSSVDMCCIKVVRDVAIEKEEDEMEMAKKSSMDSNENKI